MEIYKRYTDTIKDNLSLEKDDWYFKGDRYYRDILEHCSVNQGKEYLSAIKKRYNNVFTKHKDYLIELCHMNDLYGKTHRSHFDEFTECSPSNLRYILHSLLIIEYARKIPLNNINIVEIGGGYGGLALFVNKLAPLFKVNINSYIIFDLYEASLLSQQYLKAHNITVQTAHLTPNSVQTLHKNSFLISNYALSEITPALQKEYVDQVLHPYISHGFLTWNFPKIFSGDFYQKFIADKNIFSTSEFPQTNKGNINSYVYFRPKNEKNLYKNLSVK